MASQLPANPFDKPKVFISYARKDGEALAVDLRDRITAAVPELAPWMDHFDMQGDQGWWDQIAKAIEGSWALVLVLTPAALASKVVGMEWQHARRQGVPVIPIKGVPDDQIDYAALPRWMSKSDLYGLEKHWDKVLHDLRNQARPPRVPFMAEPLPDGFVPRPAEYDRLLSYLLAGERGDPVAATPSCRGPAGLARRPWRRLCATTTELLPRSTTASCGSRSARSRTCSAGCESSTPA